MFALGTKCAGTATERTPPNTHHHPLIHTHAAPMLSMRGVVWCIVNCWVNQEPSVAEEAPLPKGTSRAHMPRARTHTFRAQWNKIA